MVAFVEYGVDSVRGLHFAGNDDAQPNFCLVEFFDSDFEFVDKIGRTFRPTRFGVMWSRGRAAAKQLSGYMPTR